MEAWRVLLAELASGGAAAGIAARARAADGDRDLLDTIARCADRVADAESYAFDPVTGGLGRRRVDEVLATESARAERYAHPLAVLLVDVDRFKPINDARGHLAGDGVLRAVADAARGAVRRTDVVGRWGGDEFLIVLPMADGAAAAVVAERVRAAVLRTGVTVSIGGAAAGDRVARADVALGLAKRGGGNRAVIDP